MGVVCRLVRAVLLRADDRSIGPTFRIRAGSTRGGVVALARPVACGVPRGNPWGRPRRLALDLWLPLGRFAAKPALGRWSGEGTAPHNYPLGFLPSSRGTFFTVASDSSPGSAAPRRRSLPFVAVLVVGLGYNFWQVKTA